MEESAFYGYPNKKEAEKSQKQEEITMKKKLTLVMIIITIIEAVCMFVPGVFKELTWYPDYYPIGTYTLSDYQPGVNAFHTLHNAFAGILSYLTIALVAVSAVSLIFSFLEKENNLAKYSAWLPFASFISFIALSVYACNFVQYKSEIYSSYSGAMCEIELDMNWLFYIMIILFAVVMALSLVVRFAKIEDAPAKKWSAQMSIADEIKKYKELLDSGIITQEEFEAKKSELMK